MGAIDKEISAGQGDGFNPAAIFLRQIQRSTDAVLARIQNDGPRTPSHKDQQRALKTVNHALGRLGDWPSASRLLTELAPKMEQAGAPQQWVQLLESGLKESQRLQDRQAEAQLTYHLGAVYRIWTRFEESQQLFEQSAEAFAQVNLPEQQAHSLCHSADVARLQQDKKRATILVETAFALLNQASNHSDCSRFLTIGYGHLVLGSLALEQEELQVARQSYENALQIYQKIGALRMIATTQGNLGIVYARLGQYAAALDVYRQAVDIFSEIEDVIQSTRFQMNIGNIYLHQDEWTKAIATYSVVEPVYRRIGDKLSLANCWYNLGLAYRGSEKFNQAHRALQDAMALYGALGRTSDAMDTLAELGITYKMQSRYKEAIAAIEKVKTYLATQESTPDIIEFQKVLAKYLIDIENEADQS